MKQTVQCSLNATAIIAAALLFIVADCRPLRAQTQKNAPSGFLGIKWGDSMAQAKKTLKVRGATTFLTGDKYALTVKGLKVTGHPTDSVMLHFGDDGFFDADVYFPKPDGVQSHSGERFYNEIKQTVIAQFGPPSLTNPKAETGRPEVLSQWNFQTPKEKLMIRVVISRSMNSLLSYQSVDRSQRDLARLRALWAKQAKPTPLKTKPK